MNGGSAPTATRELTRQLAAWAAGSHGGDLPPAVRTEAARGFLNWIGCALGGCREPAVAIAAATVAELGGAAQAGIIGHAQRTDIASAAFVNCIASSVMAFDDAHLATVTHSSGPVGAALLAFAEHHPTRGEAFLHAYALGIELTCRMSNAIALAPSSFNAGFYITGLSAPIGVAAAIGRLLEFDEARMNAAIGIGASQASGFRATHGTMTAHLRPGHAARCGVWAAMLASRGFTSDDHALEAGKGFFDVYAPGADLGRAVEGLGRDFELLANAYKPYPCGIVIHPIVDACLDVHARRPAGATPREVKLQVHPLALSMTGIRTPVDTLESHVSLYHWAAAALLRGAAGIPEASQDCIDDPAIASLRARIVAVEDRTLGRDQAVADVTYDDGAKLRARIEHARGSRARPMTDEEIDAKYRAQAGMVLAAGRVDELLRRCRGLASLADVGKEITALLSR